MMIVKLKIKAMTSLLMEKLHDGFVNNYWKNNLFSHLSIQIIIYFGVWLLFSTTSFDNHKSVGEEVSHV